ncbi:3-hydroxyacyl-[acyl-carrier-protein] dehydratase FabZ [Candidatus Woesearchaeota archaeon]|nr:3-hydroxyacyl-[acyl-carrier-protein] dehydratase FabZ [Candidatus Woesearchaeota archaeon]
MGQINELKNEKGEIDAEGIKKIIPYDEPFLFIDKVLSLSSNRIVAVKKLTGREDFFKGHFVDFPIMPGALTVEGLGQTATLLARSNIPNHKEKDVLAYKLKEVKFMAPILPGDEVRFELNLIAQDERGAILQGKVFVKEDLMAEALLMLAIVNKTEFRAKYSK